MIRYWKPEGKAIWQPYKASQKPPPQAKYATVLTLSQEYNESVPVKYSGPFYTDFDGELETVLLEVCTALRILDANYEVPLDQIYCYFTGGRGFHIMIHQNLFHKESDVMLPRIYKRMAYEMFNFTTLDMAVYSGKRGRMWRITNRKRPNGHYKIPVTAQEILNQPIEWFVEKSKNPRRNFLFPATEEFDLVRGLVNLFNKCKETVITESQNLHKDPVTLSQIAELENQPPCIKTLATTTKLVKPEIFNRYAMVVAGYLVGKPDISYLDNFLMYNFTDSEHYPTWEKRRQHVLDLKRYFSNSDYVFGCEYVRSLKGIKFDCQSCPLLKTAKSKYSLKDIKDLFQAYMVLPEESLEMVDVALAAVISIHLPDDPVWLLIVAPPSSAKSELINALSKINYTYMISEYTPKTMASGKGKETALLNKLKPTTTLLFKDFTTVLEMRSEDKAAIFAQLRELYDGYYRKVHGNGVIVEWTGKLGIVAAVTEIIDTQYKIAKILGERFVQYRLKEPDPEDVARMALKVTGTEKDLREKIKTVTKSFAESIDLSQEIKFPNELKDELVYLSIFTVKTRTGTVRDWRKQIELIPHSEGPARIAKQLKAVAKCLAIVQGKNQVDEKIMRIVRKMAFDSITALKKSIVSTLCMNGNEELSTAELAEKVGYPPSTVKEAAFDLFGQEIVIVDLQGNEEDSQKAYIWSLGKWGNYYKKHLFTEPGLPF